MYRGAEYAGTFFARHFLWKGEKCLEMCGSEGHFFARHFCEKMKSARKGAEVKDTFLPGPSGKR